MAEAATRPNSTVFVGGLDTKFVTAAALSEAFIPFGEIVDISLPKPETPSSTDLHRGYGYVEFEEAGDAKEAIDNMDQSELFGRVIKVAMAKPDRRDAGGPSLVSTTAVWEQEGYLAKYGEMDREPMKAAADDRPEDPMQGLEDLDTAGPKIA
jgi:RNA recognition motif-containing protein